MQFVTEENVNLCAPSCSNPIKFGLDNLGDNEMVHYEIHNCVVIVMLFQVFVVHLYNLIQHIIIFLISPTISCSTVVVNE